MNNQIPTNKLRGELGKCLIAQVYYATEKVIRNDSTIRMLERRCPRGMSPTVVNALRQATEQGTST